MALLSLLKFFHPIISICLVLLSGSATGASHVNNGISVTFNDIPYFISPYSAASLPKDPPGIEGSVELAGLYPMTVLPNVSSSNFSALVDSCTAKDDVFQPGFLQIVYTRQDSDELGVQSSYGVNTVIKLEERDDIPPGPYFLSATTGEAFPPYRLYSDFSGSFTESLLASPDGNFTTLSASIPGAASLTIGVPSRLYYNPSPEQPLAGIRVGIKDIFDVAGVKTSNGNRAWYNLYPPAIVNSEVVQKLVDAGAILVGKQKTSQFANGENPTADWVDYHAPFNARADGYQDTSSSSSGAGSSISSYSWLDIALGSDTGGSIRGPSAVQGLYGNRPSRGAIDLTGAMPLSPALDTAGFLARDPEVWSTVQTAVYGESPSYNAYPSKILTYGFPTDASSSPANAIIINFLGKLQSFLSANVSSINVISEWTASHPENATSDLNEYLNITYAVFVSRQQSTLVRNPFYEDYGAVHDGRRPFVNPNAFTRWSYADTLPSSALDDAYNNKTVFMNWFNSNILTPDPATCSNAFLLYPGSTGIPDARNIYTDAPMPPFGFVTDQFSVFAEVPDSVFPIGQSPYFSDITQHEEYLPVAIDILAAKGCDSIIAKLAQDLFKAGILNATQAGQTIYGGEILLRRGMEVGQQ